MMHCTDSAVPCAWAEQVFTDIPEHSLYKGTEFGNVGDPVYAGKWQRSGL